MSTSTPTPTLSPMDEMITNFGSSCNLCQDLNEILSFISNPNNSDSDHTQTQNHPTMLKLLLNNFPTLPKRTSSFVGNNKKSKTRIVADFANNNDNDNDNNDPKAKKAVRFSPDQDVIIHLYDLPYDDEAEKSELFYGLVEYIAMLGERDRAIKHAIKRHATLSPSSSSESINNGNDGALLSSYSYTGLNGIENYVVPRIAAMAASSKDRCLRAVLNEQAKQVASGEYNPDEIAFVSQLRSMWAVKRAEQIGFQQSR